MRQALSHVEHAPFKLARKKEDKCRKQLKKKNSKGEKEEFFFFCLRYVLFATVKHSQKKSSVLHPTNEVGLHALRRLEQHLSPVIPSRCHSLPHASSVDEFAYVVQSGTYVICGSKILLFPPASGSCRRAKMVHMLGITSHTAIKLKNGSPFVSHLASDPCVASASLTGLSLPHRVLKRVPYLFSPNLSGCVVAFGCVPIADNNTAALLVVGICSPADGLEPPRCAAPEAAGCALL